MLFAQVRDLIFLPDNAKESLPGPEICAMLPGSEGVEFVVQNKNKISFADQPVSSLFSPSCGQMRPLRSQQ